MLYHTATIVDFEAAPNTKRNGNIQNSGMEKSKQGATKKMDRENMSKLRMTYGSVGMNHE